MKNTTINTIENILKAADNDLSKCHLKEHQFDDSVIISNSSLLKNKIIQDKKILDYDDSPLKHMKVIESYSQ